MKKSVKQFLLLFFGIPIGLFLSYFVGGVHAVVECIDFGECYGGDYISIYNPNFVGIFSIGVIVTASFSLMVLFKGMKGI